MVYPCDTFPLQSSLTWVMTSTSFYRDALCRSSCLTDLLRALFLWLFSTPSFRLVVIEVVSRRLKLYLVLQSKTLKSSEKIKVVKTCKKLEKCFQKCSFLLWDLIDIPMRVQRYFSVSMFSHLTRTWMR